MSNSIKLTALSSVFLIIHANSKFMSGFTDLETNQYLVIVLHQFVMNVCSINTPIMNYLYSSFLIFNGISCPMHSS